MQHRCMPTCLFVNNIISQDKKVVPPLYNCAIKSHNYIEEKLTARSNHKTSSKLPQ